MANVNDLVMSRPGQVNKTGAVDAMFLKLFLGEVLTAFDEKNIMKDLHMVRTIDHGKSASFPILGKATARYHVPGTPILGFNQIAANERVINIDVLLIADLAIYDLEDAKNHYDVRGEYSKQIGAALAREFDKKTMRVAVKAARTAGIIDDEPGGSVIKGGATIATDADVLAEALFNAAQIFDEKDITVEDRHVILAPAQYYLLAQNTKVLNKDWNGSGSYSDGKIMKIAGITILTSNNLPNENIASKTTGENNDYTGDFTNTVGLVLQKSAIGTVKLRDIQIQKSGNDFNIMYQATLMVAKMAVGHGILRPGCAIELSKEAPGVGV